MSASAHDGVFQSRRLWELIEADGELERRGFSLEWGLQGAVVVARRQHVRGFWAYDDGSFAWTPAGNTEPTIQLPTAQKAAVYTLDVLTVS